MTYANFLLVFLLIPIAGLAALNWRDGRLLPAALSNLPTWLPVALHVIIAVLYTTPWDNYLVATGVWYYNPALVIGIRLGWVPVEEYTFFVLQTILSGLWLAWLARRLAFDSTLPPWRNELRLGAAGLTGLVWVAAVVVFFNAWRPFTYLGLILLWALPPILLQLAFGADILWKHRRLVGITLLSTTMYLAATDSLAIASGTWTIAPGQSLHIFLGSLPLEELVFFFVTNALIVFGVVLTLAPESRERFQRMKSSARLRLAVQGRSSGQAGNPGRSRTS